MVCLRFCILFDKRKTKCIIRLLSRVVDHVFVHKRQKDAKDFCEAAAIAVFFACLFSLPLSSAEQLLAPPG